jgi:hypothetical protein
MDLLVRKEILDVLEEINQLSDKDFYISKFIEDSDLTNAESVAPVQFDINNCKLISIDSPGLKELLDLYHIDSQNILLVSTLLAHGFITTMQGYYSTLERLITGKSNGSL